MSNIGNKETMAKNLDHYLNKMGKTQKELCEDLDFRPSTVNGWFTAKKYPRIDKIEMMADYFGILKSDLIEEHEQHNPLFYRGTIEGLIGKDPVLVEMILKYLKLDDQKKKAVKQMIDTLSE